MLKSVKDPSVLRISQITVDWKSQTRFEVLDVAKAFGDIKMPDKDADSDVEVDIASALKGIAQPRVPQRKPAAENEFGSAVVYAEETVDGHDTGEQKTKS